MGPIYKHEHYGAEEVDQATEMPRNLVRLPLYDEVLTQSFSDSGLRSIAGNTMPLPMIGAALCFVLACTERVCVADLPNHLLEVLGHCTTLGRWQSVGG